MTRKTRLTVGTASVIVGNAAEIPKNGTKTAKGLNLKHPTEKQFMAQVIKLGTLFGWRIYHTHDSRRCVPGFPDLLLLRGERIIAAELKVGKGRATDEQEAWLEAFRDAFAEAYLWRWQDWDDIVKTLR